MSNETVVLHTAFSWDCPNCGTTNYGKPAPVELTNEDKAELREEHGVDDAVTGEFIALPEEVECSSCHKEYATLDESDIEGEDKLDEGTQFGKDE